jgi:hypothetical protein
VVLVSSVSEQNEASQNVSFRFGSESAFWVELITNEVLGF